MQGPVRSGPREGSAKSAPVADRSSPSPLELLWFALRSARRHWLLGVGITLLAGVVGVAVVFAIPGMYESTSKIYITQNNALTASLASGRRSDEANAALRGLREAVLNQENLLALVRETKLVESWPRTRTWPLRLKDKLMVALAGEPPLAEKERALMEMLEQSLWVYAEEGTSIRFTAWWRDPEAAYRLAELAQRNFLAGRTSDEAASITRAMALLEDEQKRADQAIEPAIKDMQGLIAKARASGQAAPPPVTGEPAAKGPRASAPGPVANDDSLERLQEVRRAQRDVSDPWQRRLADLRLQLSELRATFGPAHPLVTQQEAKVAAASETPTELARLRQEESEIVENLGRATLQPEAPTATAVRRPTAAAPRAPTLQRDEDPELAAARVRVEAALAKSRDLSSRLDAARLEYATSQASAKYRYSVVERAEQSRTPFKPKRAVLLAGALAIALLLGFLAGSAKELATGRMLEAWQVRRLGLDVLGEIELDELIKRRPSQP